MNKEYIVGLSKNAAQSAHKLAGLSADDKNKILKAIADAIVAEKAYILMSNRIDIEAMAENDPVFVDRLTLNDARVSLMVEGINQIIALPDPIGEVTAEYKRPNGLDIKKIRCPLGVIAIIYEARPNVTVDAAALCIKSGNSVILRGSKGAINSNRAIYSVMKNAIEKAGYDSNIVQFVDDIDREGTKILLKQDKYIDVVIPRGGEGLKNFIFENSRIPVIASAGGNCHIYIQKTADLDMALNIVLNAKCQRPSVCNAAEHLLVDRSIAAEFLPSCLKKLVNCGVKILGGKEIMPFYSDVLPVTEDDLYTEFHDLIISVTLVDDVKQAVAHINKYNTKHSEAIITEDKTVADYFTKNVDAACVYVNASTRFTDGFEFGFGAEMGISTGKLHARGPLGLRELTSQKYVISGDGQVRE